MSDNTSNPKKPVWKRGWFIALVVLFGLGIIGSFIPNDSGVQPAATDKTATPATQTPVNQPQVEEKKETAGQRNALRAAKNYLSFAAFSRSGLIKQLEFEGYSAEDAAYGADNAGADWGEQAVKSAKHYLSFTAFSRSGLIKQLEFEGFTNEEAVYGVNATGL